VTTAEIEGVPSVRIISVRVLDQENLKFTCELEVEAEVEVFIIAQRERHYRDDVESFEGRHVHRTKIAYFYPEVIVHFDPSTGDLEFDSVHVPEQAVEVGRDDVVL
jgi:hypothetical protein